LEHARIYYFHHQAKPKVYVGSMDIMVRSFYRRIEALFMIQDPLLKQQVISVLLFNLKDNINSYLMQSDGNYVKKEVGEDVPFNLHQELFKVSLEDIQKAKLFD
jgi:polyphosphate kinase